MTGFARLDGAFKVEGRQFRDLGVVEHDGTGFIAQRAGDADHLAAEATAAAAKQLTDWIDRRHALAVRQGRTVLIVSHRVSSVKDADHVIVLAGGRIIADGAPGAVRSDEGVLAAYLGGEHV